MTDTTFAAVLRRSATWKGIWQCRMRVAAMCAEMILVIVAYVAAIRAFEPSQGHVWARHGLDALAYLLIIRFCSFLYFGTYKSMLKHAGITDAIRICEAVAAGSVVFAGASVIWRRPLHLPLAFYFFEAGILLFLLFAMHFGLRVLRVHRALGRRTGKRAVIVGAGNAGATVTRELALNPDSEVLPVAILDDDSLKQGAEICGVPVAGGLDRLKQVIREKNAEEILVCIPSATREKTRDILMSCLEWQIPVRMLPSLKELAGGSVSHQDLRNVRMEDVLQRDEISYDPAVVASIVDGKVVLVTGAGGTIGSELSRQIAAANPRLLLLLDKSENNLFYTHLEITERFPNVATKPLLVDVVRNELVEKVFAEEKPQLVFHAAAHKHVGLLEIHPKEAIRNNVLGTRNVLLAAAKGDVERFVNISTDKAVNPRCFMGLSKKLTEMLTREMARTQSKRFMNVRFGNVAGSSGSVLKIFWDQVQKGKPLRVTDPSATRYFMRISEAVYLVLRAATLGKGGETFILEMGEPLNIYELARTVSLISGFIPEEELPIEFVGLRQGEKLHEELWEDWENPRPTELGQILVISQSRRPPFSMLDEAQRLESLLGDVDTERLEKYVSRLIPSFLANREQKTNSFESPEPFEGLEGQKKRSIDPITRDALLVLKTQKAESA
jgi:FlaA1/EpsC-like NDP-sugar epimerase